MAAILRQEPFERLARIASQLLGARCGAFSVVDAGSEHILAAHGLESLSPIPRSCSFAAWALEAADLFVVADALADPRFRTNPLVTGPLGLRFCAGMAVRSPAGRALAVLSVMNPAPLDISAGQAAALADVAAIAAAELDLRLAVSRSLAAEDRRRQDTRYRELFENAGDLVYTLDLHANFTSLNKAVERVLGYRREELIGRSVFGLLDEEAGRLVQEKIREKLGGLPQTTYELEVRAKDGRLVTLEVSSRLQFENGRPVGIQGIARDITERRKAEAQLRLLRSVVVHANDAIAVARLGAGDPLAAPLVYVNEAFARITGYEARDVRTGLAALLNGEETDLRQLERMREAVLRGESVRVELVWRRRDGSPFWADVNAAAIADTKGAFGHWVCVFRDVTERKQAEMLERDRNQILEMVAANAPLETVLARLAALVERQAPGVACAVLLVRHGRLRFGAAPRLPTAYGELVDGLEVSAAPGLLAKAASGLVVLCEDLAAQEPEGPLRSLLSGLGFEAAWCVPVLSGSGGVLGIVAAYGARGRDCDPQVLELCHMASRLAAVAIEQRQLTDMLAWQARHDALTGLPNRFLLEERLESALVRASRNDWMVAVLLVDLDRFKQINDTLGHAVGDALLREVSARFEACLRRADILARMGGDEFLVVLSELRDVQDAQRVAEKLLDALRSPFLVRGYELFVTASIGISVYPRDGRDAATLQRNADSAMYRAKSRGKNRFQFFTPELGAAMLEQMELETALRRALDQKELTLFYQPQMSADGLLAGMEALLVWNHPRLGPIPPAQFIPVAEDSGLIVPIGTWVLQEACRQNATWVRRGLPKVRVAANVSPMQFARTDFIDAVAQALASSGLEPGLLELELTESIIMRDVEESLRQMERLRALGVSISIDDFGTGYSSLSYLRRLPIDSVKIDQSFLAELERDTSTLPLIRAIVSVAHSLGLTVVAEGVENEAQAAALRAVGCDRMQGYLYGGALPAAEVERLLVNRTLVSG
ncbi:MAG: EAL domain-containing protein [Bryobacteraceae bacterium]|nr:EAL domain-containing protein [Bryobacteraceae bacterium]